MNKQRIIFSIFGLVAGLILGAAAMAVVYNNKLSKQPEPTEQAPGGMISVEGKFVCLPHKDTDGPQTLECASGIRTDDNKYYAIEGSLGEFSSSRDEHVKVSGTLKSNETTIYQSEGVIVLGTIEATE